MVIDEQVARQTASYLLQIKSIELEIQNPFKWASGWKSPIYCDNRKILSYPEVRNYIAEELAFLIQSEYPDTEVIAGVATGGIAHGALVADKANLPFIYVRSAAKEHGLGNVVEGNLIEGQKVVIVEDLVSTGKSSLFVVEQLKKAGANVLGMVSIFDYGFDASLKKFRDEKCDLFSLCNYEQLIKQAVEERYADKEELSVLKKWRVSPDTWMQ